MRVNITVNPEDRITGLLESNNRYLMRARAAEGRNAVLVLALNRIAESARDLELIDPIEAVVELAADALADRDTDESFQAQVLAHLKYVCEADGVNDPTDLDERRDRFGEEALELYQSLGGTLLGAMTLAFYVFSRPIGHPPQEFGGTMTTLAGLAAYAGESLEACGERELARTWDPAVIAKIRGKRAGRHGRGPLPGADADLVTGAVR